jgi:hypothetical protein
MIRNWLNISFYYNSMVLLKDDNELKLLNILNISCLHEVSEQHTDADAQRFLNDTSFTNSVVTKLQ